jgi:DNA-directed RNA polymerase subunit RPC12/RpoP
MKHICSNCKNIFAVERKTRSKKAWGLGLGAIYTTDYAAAIDAYQVVICPKCGHEERDERLRIFGIFKSSAFKIAIYVVVTAMLICLLLQFFFSR